MKIDRRIFLAGAFVAGFANRWCRGEEAQENQKAEFWILTYRSDIVNRFGRVDFKDIKLGDVIYKLEDNGYCTGKVISAPDMSDPENGRITLASISTYDKMFEHVLRIKKEVQSQNPVLCVVISDRRIAYGVLPDNTTYFANYID